MKFLWPTSLINNFLVNKGPPSKSKIVCRFKYRFQVAWPHVLTSINTKSSNTHSDEVVHHVNDFPWNNFPCSGFTQEPLQGRNEGRKRGHNSPGVESLGTPRSSNNVTSTFFKTAHLLLKNLRFKRGDAKHVSCPGRRLNSVRPCAPSDAVEIIIFLKTCRICSIHQNRFIKTGSSTCSICSINQNRFINVQNLFNSSKQVDGTIHLVSVRGWK